VAGTALPAYVTNPPTGIAQGVWDCWNYAYTVYGNGSSTIGTSLAYDPGGVWGNWNAGYPYSSATTYTQLITVPQWGAWNTRYEETQEQRAARQARIEAQAQQIQQAQHAERAHRAAVNSRAEQLLMSLLTDEQARTYTEHGWFEVRGSAGGRWRIRNRGQAGNVDLMPEIGNESRSDPDRDVRLMSFCCHSPGSLPDADAHVAQMLHLVTDEEGFRRVANVSYRRPEPQSRVPVSEFTKRQGGRRAGRRAAQRAAA
jgi:hypothetical protein